MHYINRLFTYLLTYYNSWVACNNIYHWLVAVTWSSEHTNVNILAEMADSQWQMITLANRLQVSGVFTLSLQAQNLPFQHILPTLILLLCWTAFTITGPDRTYHASRFILVCFSLIFLFVPCGRLSWLHVSFLLHVKYTLWYRIIHSFWLTDLTFSWTQI